MNKLFTLVFLLFSTWSTSQMIYPGSVDIMGPEETVFDYSEGSCDGQMSVDGCPQVFRDADGNIQLVNMHTTSFRMIGADFDNLVVDCDHIIHDSDNDPDPANFNYKEWLASTWTEDGATIYGLVHNEWHGYDFDGECLSTDVMKCWYNGITLVQSVDTGKSYSHVAAPDHLIASVPYEYDASLQSRQGAFSPSNIVKHPTDGFYYCIFYTEENINGTDSYLQRGGSCVMRTTDLSDPSSWRVWNGESYDTEPVNPYTDDFLTEDHLLEPVMGGKQLSSLTYNTFFEQWMIAGPSRKYNLEEDRLIQGFYYQLSDNLIDWTGPKLLMEMNFPDSQYNNDDLFQYGMYPAIIDHEDENRNFMYSSQDCYLYYMTWNTYPMESSGSPNRDLKRIPISFNRSGVSSFTINGRGSQYDANPGDGVCATSSGLCSFYAAIQESNSRLPKYVDSLLTINFDVNGLNFNLPDAPFACQYPMYFDGWTQPGSAMNTLSIEEGFNAEPGIQFSFNGNPALVFEGGDSGLRGIIIKGHQGPAVTFKDKGNNTVEGCYLGTDSEGMTDQATPTAGSGVLVEDCDGNLIGGKTVGKHNIIVGGVALLNSDNNQVQGNYVGVGADGQTSLENNGSIGLDINESSNNQIGTSSLEARNLWAGGYNRAISITGEESINNIVENNFVGINLDATEAIGSHNVGIYLGDNASENSIGIPASPNLLGATSNGVAMIIAENGAHDNNIASNYIGTNWLGTSDLLAEDDSGLAGIYIGENAYNNVIGSNGTKNNIITNGHLHGIVMLGTAGEGNTIISNSIYGNDGMGIDLFFDNMVNENDNGDADEGPNGVQNFPIIENAVVTDSEVTLTGFLESAPSANFDIQFFKNDECDESGYGEAKSPLGTITVTTDDQGLAEFEFQGGIDITTSDNFTAIATSEEGNSSEIGPCIAGAIPEPDIMVNPEEIVVSTPQGEAVMVTLTITNEGTEALSWSASNGAFWLQLSNSGGYIYSGQSVDVLVLLLISAMPVGEYYDSIIIESNDPDEGVIEIPVIAYVTEEPFIEFSPGSLDITQAANMTMEYDIEISNVGSGVLSWSSTAPIQDSWIYPTGTTNGDLENGETSTTEVAINTNGLEVGIYESDVVINSNAVNEPQAFIHVTLNVEEGFVPTLETSVFEYDYCPGYGAEISFWMDANVAGNNEFTAELSDENGSFNNPVTIGQLWSGSSSGEMMVTIPTGLVGGNGYRIRVNASNPVVLGDSNESDITIHPWTEVTYPDLNDVCIITPPFALPEAQPEGGVWFGPGVIGNIFEPQEAGVGVHEITYEIESPEGCMFKATKELEVTPTPQLELTELGPFCENSAEVDLIASPSGGSWIGEGVNSGVFSPTEAGAGEHELTYIYAAGGVCAATGSIIIEIFELPETTVPTQGDYCEGDEFIPLFGGTPEGGEYWGDHIVGNNFDPQSSGVGSFVVNYSYTDNIGCSNTATSQLTIYPTPEISFETPESICENSDPIQVVSNDQNCAFSGDGMIGDTFFPALAGIGSHVISCIAINEFGCQSEDSAEISVVASPDVGIDPVPSMCDNAEVLPLDMGIPSGGSYHINGITASFIDPSMLGPGVHSLSYAYGDDACTATAMTSFEIFASPAPAYITFDGIMLNSDAPEGNQWYLNGQAIDGATGTSLLPEGSGDYSVEISIEGCVSDFSNVININITGVNDIEEDGFSVYPVPFDDKIIIVSGERWPDETQIRLYDNAGRLVHFSKASHLPYSNGKYVFKESLTELPKGQYFLLIMLNGAIKRAALQK